MKFKISRKLITQYGSPVTEKTYVAKYSYVNIGGIVEKKEVTENSLEEITDLVYNIAASHKAKPTLVFNFEFGA